MSDSTTFSSSSENYPSSSQNYPSSSQNYSSSSQNYPSSSQNFSANLLYALAELQMSHLGLKDEQERAMLQFWKAMMFLCCCQLALVRVSATKLFLSCSTISWALQ